MLEPHIPAVNSLSCCIRFLLLHINRHKFSSLNPYLFISPQFYRSEIKHNMTGFSIQSEERLKSRSCPSWVLVGRGNSTSKLFEVVGRIQVRGGGRTEVPASVLAFSLGTCSQLLEAAHIHSHLALSTFKVSNTMVRPSYTSDLSDFSPSLQLEKGHSRDGIRPTWITSPPYGELIWDLGDNHTISSQQYLG